ncbi:taste receptor type 2 member 1-like [Latimeria chalumnae]|uniref:taste receptor type 2 member 1-like n=1 Tax=Latimeria chalumnae TaxID=7897 RepID=UPI0003C145F8|nr:PREDICTED: taste receptor type 2 member 1-like [Latimeria chalumnae]|eukprot:XP_006011509.1 PREDICTED: taste receptor type 2 member 1-like [Latimeria chalumnae]
MATADLVQLGIAMFIIVIGCLGNAYIVLVFLLEYRRSQTLQPYEVIVTLMAACSIVTELVSAIWYVVYLLNFCTYFGNPIYKITDFIDIYLPKTIIWLTAWLCFVYCVKIVKVNWRFFMRLKQRLSLAVKCMIAGTLLLCILLAFPCTLFIRLKLNTTSVCQDYYRADEGKEVFFIYTSMLSFLTSLLPLILMLFSSLGIVTFLCLHSRNMDKNVTSSSTSRIDAHTSVAIMLLCLIALFIACASTALSVNLQVASGQFDVLIAILYTNIIYSSGSPVILVIGTVKLRNIVVKLLCRKQGM